MTDALADRCSRLVGAIIPLMQAAIESQGDPARLGAVLEQTAAVRGVLAAGTAGIDQPDYLAWSRTGPGLLDAMEAAAREGDAATVWKLFTDPEIGFHKLSAACAGQPGW